MVANELEGPGPGARSDAALRRLLSIARPGSGLAAGDGAFAVALLVRKAA